MEMKQLFHHCIDSRYFTLNVLNDRIRSFPFGPAEASNRPSQISATTLCSDDNSLKQSGIIQTKLCVTLNNTSNLHTIQLHRCGA